MADDYGDILSHGCDKARAHMAGREGGIDAGAVGQ